MDYKFLGRCTLAVATGLAISHAIFGDQTITRRIEQPIQQVEYDVIDKVVFNAPREYQKSELSLILRNYSQTGVHVEPIYDPGCLFGFEYGTIKGSTAQVDMELIDRLTKRLEEREEVCNPILNS